MGKMKILLPILAVVAIAFLAEACNEAICASQVSKCMLINCCHCEMTDVKNCTCCRDCQICLSDLYTECCSCVGLCPPSDPYDDLAKSSSIEDLPDPVPELFNALTDLEDPVQRWTTYTYGVDLDQLFKPDSKTQDMDIKIIGEEGENTASKEKLEHNLGVKNCTVAFFSECMSIKKCKQSCKSMGAAKYRWFHEHGCCQCVGNSCYDYGLKEPKCLKCNDSYDKWVHQDRAQMYQVESTTDAV